MAPAAPLPSLPPIFDTRAPHEGMMVINVPHCALSTLQAVVAFVLESHVVFAFVSFPFLSFLTILFIPLTSFALTLQTSRTRRKGAAYCFHQQRYHDPGSGKSTCSCFAPFCLVSSAYFLYSSLTTLTEFHKQSTCGTLPFG